MKPVLKLLLGVISRVLVAPLAYPVRCLAFTDGRHLIFQCGSQFMSLIPGVPGVYLRREYYKVTLGLRSRGFVVEFGAISVVGQDSSTLRAGEDWGMTDPL